MIKIKKKVLKRTTTDIIKSNIILISSLVFIMVTMASFYFLDHLIDEKPQSEQIHIVKPESKRMAQLLSMLPKSSMIPRKKSWVEMGTDMISRWISPNVISYIDRSLYSCQQRFTQIWHYFIT